MNENVKKIYLLGGVLVIIAFGLTLTDILIGSLISGDLSLLPQTATERFSEFHESRLLGLYHLDMLNVIISAVMIPVFFALTVIHQDIKPFSSSLALTFFLVATTIFITTNTALPMLQLSGKYFSAVSESEKFLYASAGEALLVRGEHGSPGVFIGFCMLTLSNFYISFIMLSGEVFKKSVGILGILGSSFLLTYIVLVTFFPGVKSIALIVAAPGGILALVWYFLIGIKLIKAGSGKDKYTAGEVKHNGN